MLQNKARLSTLIFIGILAVVALIIAFNAGQARGRLAVRGDLETVRSEMMVILSATPTRTPVPLIPTDTPTPTFTPTPSPSPTPTLTQTPTNSPTPTTTPASAEEWGDRYRQLVEAGLNSSALAGFSGEQAQALLRGIAQEQGLAFVPASYFELSTTPWAALVSPRTPQGAVLPMIFWLDPNDQNRVRGQLLHNELAHANEEQGLSALLGGIQAGTMRQDFMGRFHLLLVERPDLTPQPNVFVLTQPQPGQDFVPLWSSANDPLWSIESAGSQISLEEAEGELLPDLVVSGALGDGNELRRQLVAPNIILEQAPFARQWADTRWRYVAQDDAAQSGGAVLPGYSLQEAKLRSTPLTVLSYMLHYLLIQDLSSASNYTTRLDLLQQAFDLGISQPAIWLAYYVDDNDNQIFGNGATNRIRFFDNANRSRSFTALFETDADGNYRVASIEQAPAYEPKELVTPAPALAQEAATAIPAAVAATTSTVESEGTATPTPTLTTTPTFTASPTVLPTETPTVAPTLTPTPTFTASPTAAPTYTSTETATLAPTETPVPTETLTPLPTDTLSPYPIPVIPTDQAPLARADVIRFPSNLRAGPSVDFPSLAALNYAIPVDLFGITEAGDWILMRINAPDDPQNGVIGWIASNLLQVTGDLAFLPRYHADGTPLVAPTPTFTATPTSTATPGTPTATVTPTEIPTPVVQEPAPQPVAEIVAPPPDSNEQVLTVGGERIPADPLNPIEVTHADGQTGTLTIDTAEVEIWSGIFGEFPGRWVASPPELLWPGSQLYVQGSASSDDATRLVATHVRIATAPVQPRAQLLSMTDMASAVADGRAVAMLGSREEAGIYMLSTDATLRQLYTDEKEADWAGSDPAAGIVVSTQDAPTGKNQFSWVRGDGIGVEIFAQPYHSVRGVFADVLGGLWWIETPQADLDLWQLWRYDPVSGNVKLELRGTGEIFQAASALVKPALTPLLLGAFPNFDGAQGKVTDVTLVLDTMERQTQTLYTGVFRLNVRLDGDQPGELNGVAQLLLTPESYRGPLQISPDRSKLAYFVFEPNQPSLTSGFIRPANMLRVLTMEGRGASTIRTVYAADNRFEFLAPNVEWQGNERIVIARSRFAPGDTFGIQRFGLVQVQLPPADQPGGTVTIRSYLFPVQRELRDYTTCQDGTYTLTIATLEDGNLELARWDGGDQPQAIFLLPSNMSRSFLCWQAPDSLAPNP